MSLYSEAPPFFPFRDAKPSLLVCWWITVLCTTIILLRVGGRYVRTERLFIEDKVVAVALIPMWARMGCVQVILMYGTNNAQLAGADLTPEQIHQKSIASGLVLLSRILYAATLWTLKNAILEFFKRLTGVTWERSYDVTLLFIRCTLAVTLVAVIISDLAECHPFSHYWQVLPDPGGQCRQGYAQLITLASCNVITDLLLIFFPVPIILRSTMPVKRKIRLVLLFSLSFGVIGVTLYRVPQTIWRGGNQTYRSLLASVELLFATAAANGLVLGSFVRDRGVKKKRFKYGSLAVDSLDQSHGPQSRRPTVNRQWGSDEDLVRDLGLGVDRALRERPDHPEHGGLRLYTPAPIMAKGTTEQMNAWRFPEGSRPRSGATGSDDSLLGGHEMMTQTTNGSANLTTARRVSFFDIGGLLLSDGSPTSAAARGGSFPNAVDDPVSPHGMPSPSPAHNASTTGRRRGSTAILQDIGGLLGPVGSTTQSPRSKGREMSDPPPIPQEASPSHRSLLPEYSPTDEGPELIDAGGLLGPSRRT